MPECRGLGSFIFSPSTQSKSPSNSKSESARAPPASVVRSRNSLRETFRAICKTSDGRALQVRYHSNVHSGSLSSRASAVQERCRAYVQARGGGRTIAVPCDDSGVLPRLLTSPQQGRFKYLL